MPNHVWLKHKNCTKHNCQICEGGLAVCTVCGGGEGSLTTDCPGHQLSASMQDAIYAGSIDYKDGLGWIDKNV